MRDIIWIFGGIGLMLLAAFVWVLLAVDVRLYPLWSPWRGMYELVRGERGKKYKSREDVV
jgi:hypothetical protein